MRAGLTQAELSERTGRDRSVIARWEQGVASPPVESLLACVHACGYDIPLVLQPIDTRLDDELRQGAAMAPIERVRELQDRLAREGRS